MVQLETRRQQRQSTMIRRLSALAAGVALLVAAVSMVVKPAGASLAAHMENSLKHTLENTLAYNAPSSEEYLFQVASAVPAAVAARISSAVSRILSAAARVARA